MLTGGDLLARCRLRRLLAAGGRAAVWRPGLAVALAELGMEDEARRELCAVAAEGLDTLRPSLWLASLAYPADACAAVGDDGLAADVYRELAPHGGATVMVGHLVSCYGAAGRHLGMLATVLGDWDRAGRHFEAALDLDRRLGARTWAAHTAYEYARMLLARRRPDDRRAAARLLAEAVALAGTIGMPTLAARAAALGGRSGPASVFPDGLSAREVELLLLLARGRSNREIGTELHISEHRAANHVRRILRKTGCANRTEAAAYAHRRGLVAS